LEHPEIQVNMQNADGNTALHYLSRKKHDESVSSLLEKLLFVKKANVNISNAIGERPLHCACFRGEIETVKLLLKANADPNVITA
jgi:ankyrin repeat protein